MDVSNTLEIIQTLTLALSLQTILGTYNKKTVSNFFISIRFFLRLQSYSCNWCLLVSYGCCIKPNNATLEPRTSFLRGRQKQREKHTLGPGADNELSREGGEGF